MIAEIFAVVKYSLAEAGDGAFEESCRSECHAVSLRLNEADSKNPSVDVGTAQMSHM